MSKKIIVVIISVIFVVSVVKIGALSAKKKEESKPSFHMVKLYNFSLKEEKFIRVPFQTLEDGQLKSEPLKEEMQLEGKKIQVITEEGFFITLHKKSDIITVSSKGLNIDLNLSTKTVHNAVFNKDMFIKTEPLIKTEPHLITIGFNGFSVIVHLERQEMLLSFPYDGKLTIN